MTVYHINKGIGLASSGIEYAQKYRFDLVRDFPERQLFIFCDYIYSNYTRFTENMGLPVDVTLNVYKFMAGQENHASTYTVADFEAQLTEDFEKTESPDGRFVNFVSADGTVKYIVWLITEGPFIGAVDRVDTVIANRLQEVAHYSDRLTSVDYYSGAEVSVRYFYDEAGTLSMRQFLAGGNLQLTLLKDGRSLQGEHEFNLAFFTQLNFTPEDLVIIDRNQDLTDALFPVKNASHFVVVVHAEHFSTHLTDENWTLWNNYYEHVFTREDMIDTFITSTDAQTEKLRKQFATAGHPDVRVITIPVGTVPELSRGAHVEENKFKFLTASRLAAEKHIDVLVKAVAEAKKTLPALEFHIYGEGATRKLVEDTIKKLSAEAYITMEGHKNLADEYAKYGGYLTASGSEGFGLTILEAVAANLPLIGLDVDYGNTTFIENGVNGFRLAREEDEAQQVEEFAAAIVKLVQTLDYPRAIAASQKLAEPYLADHVRQLWRTLYDECQTRLAESEDLRS
ncbi:MAG: glycosyltransferase [Streptococcaceae bacterium]|jgi:accessory Sec system glycosylation protein GtfA|nr:glycosyltransferase [Streptococcaceae bacterium]